LDRTVSLAQNNQASLTVIDIAEPRPKGFSTIPKGCTSETLQQTITEERQEQ